MFLSSWNGQKCIAKKAPKRVKPRRFKSLELFPNASENLVRTVVIINEGILGLFDAVESSGIPILQCIHGCQFLLLEVVMNSGPYKNIEERFEIMSIQVRGWLVVKELARHVWHRSCAVIGGRCRNLSFVVDFG